MHELSIAQEIVNIVKSHLTDSNIKVKFDRLKVGKLSGVHVDSLKFCKVVILSTTEGDDKPLKYPAMFRNSSILIINKIDLLLYVDCNIEEMKKNALSINPQQKNI